MSDKRKAGGKWTQIFSWVFWSNHSSCSPLCEYLTRLFSIIVKITFWIFYFICFGQYLPSTDLSFRCQIILILIRVILKTALFGNFSQIADPCPFGENMVYFAFQAMRNIFGFPKKVLAPQNEFGIP